MTDLTIINSAADATMSPDQRDIFDTFSDDTKQRFLNQIIKRSKSPAPIDSAKVEDTGEPASEVEKWILEWAEDYRLCITPNAIDSLCRYVTQIAAPTPSTQAVGEPDLPVAYMHRWPGCGWELDFADEFGKLPNAHSTAIPLMFMDDGRCAHEAGFKCENSVAPTTGSAPVPHGWALSVSESDGRVWLRIKHPQGAECSLSAAATIDEGRGRTIAAQVLDELGKACASPASPAASVLTAEKIVAILRAYTDMDALPGDALVIALLAASMGGEPK